MGIVCKNCLESVVPGTGYQVKHDKHKMTAGVDDHDDDDDKHGVATESGWLAS